MKTITEAERNIPILTQHHQVNLCSELHSIFYPLQSELLSYLGVTFLQGRDLMVLQTLCKQKFNIYSHKIGGRKE